MAGYTNLHTGTKVLGQLPKIHPGHFLKTYLFLCLIFLAEPRRVLVLWPGIELGPLSMRVQCPNHETARKFLGFLSLLTFPLFISHIVSWLSLHSPLVLWIFSRLFKFFGIFAINVFFRDSFTDFFFSCEYCPISLYALWFFSLDAVCLNLIIW